MSRHDGLQVVKKTYAGLTVGYVVGWWRFGSNSFKWQRSQKDRTGFQSVREGLMFSTQAEAEVFRDSVETKRKLVCVNFEAV